MDGGAGSDTMIGGLGNNTYSANKASDTVIEADDGGTDTLRALLFIYSLGGDVEQLVAIRSGGLIGLGNALANVISRMAGNDNLDGAAGNDTLDGAARNHTIFGGTAGDTYQLHSDSDLLVKGYKYGFDTVTASAGCTICNNIESLVLIGSAELDATGLDRGNLLISNTAANHLWGIQGEETFVGAGAADTLDGGASGDNRQGALAATPIMSMALAIC